MYHFTALLSYLQDWCDKAPKFYTKAEQGSAGEMHLMSEGLNRKLQGSSWAEMKKGEGVKWKRAKSDRELNP